MCKYCKLDENKEICKNLIKKVLPFGKAKIVFDLDIIGDGTASWLMMDVYSKFGDEPRTLCQGISIQYCPMCGRKLNNEIES